MPIFKEYSNLVEVNIKIHMQMFYLLYYYYLGVQLCMNATIDAALINVVRQHVCKLSSDVEKMTFERMNNVKKIQENIQLCLQEFKTLKLRIRKLEDSNGKFHALFEVNFFLLLISVYF